MEMLIAFIVVGFVFLLITRWVGKREGESKDQQWEPHENIERLERAAGFFTICSWVILLFGVGATGLLLVGGRRAVVAVGGMQVNGIGGIVSVWLTVIFAFVLLRTISHWLNATANILEAQINNVARLEEQEKMLKSIGRMLKQQQQEKLEDTPINLSSVPRKD